MRHFLAVLCGLAAVSSPASALPNEPAFGTRPGAFAGATIRIPLGGHDRARPRAALTIAPTRSTISNGAAIQTKIGEGIAINLTADARPTITLAGIRADTALGLRSQGRIGASEKLGISTGGWVAIGLGSLALIAGGLYLWADHIADCEERENGCP